MQLVEKQKIYHPGVDILRIISILAVVCIHTTSRVLEASSFDLAHEPITFFLNQAARFAVPLFFMISGFVLELNYPFHATYFTYLKKRLSRVLIPYIFWSSIYFFFVYQQHSSNFLYALATGSASYQLYFIPTLLIFYLLFPLLHKYYHHISHLPILLLLGLIQLVLLFYDYSFHPSSLFYPASIALLNFYPFLLGSVASHHQKRLTTFVVQRKYLLALAALFFAGYIVYEGLSGYLQTKHYLSFYSQWRPTILLYTILISLLLFYVSQKETFHMGVIKLLSRLSFFVFFVHVIVLESVWAILGKKIFFATHSAFQQAWFDALFFTFVAGISFFLAFVVQNIHFLRKITG